MSSEWISVASSDGGQFEAYISHPPAGRGPGLLLVQEIFGVNEHIRAVADQYAADGYLVIAPDIFWRQAPRIELGYTAEGFERGLALLGGLDIHRTGSDLQRAVEAVRHFDSCSGLVGSVGFCMGGLLSYVAAARAGVDTAVCYYGGGIHDHLGLASDISCPLLFHFAAKDSYIPNSAVESVRKVFSGRDNVRVITHPDVDHGFNCWQRPSWHQPTAARARGQTLVHLSETLA
ncbi:MAG: dienelactone hydrolase family protein [Burkholderiaceae bacterium]